MLVGVGEASFISLAAPFIDDNAPIAQKTACLSVFYTCILGGYALGYVYGGLVRSHFVEWFFPADSKKVSALETVPLGVKDAEASNGNNESHEPSKSNST
ncbi:hypothetical protein KIW84_055244 [Lathyrus oleraceus]|uniref:Uncharacterized protein n=1 Tax=Pisum sativum TaxID=3888 RepID=A0A9D5AFJ9_PEA|nr:hypothetical protein KIW84_055244 [Pisum sativum]